MVRRTHEALPFVLSGIAGGLFAALVTQPADTIKTRMQAWPLLSFKGPGIWEGQFLKEFAIVMF